jgi:putative ABC transport system ATP-binding protein
MAVTVHNLRKHYIAPDGGIAQVLDVPQFAITDAEQAALVGGSGTGKTTLLHCIAGIVQPEAGRIIFHDGEESAAVGERLATESGRDENVLEYRRAGSQRFSPGVDLTELSESRRDAFRGRYVGYVFQTHHLLPGFTALENVLLGMSFTGRPADRAWAVHLLEEVGLADRLHYRPGKLSLGQQQRVAVARALANKPALVLADEPTGSLDPATAQQVLGLVRRLCTEAGAALLMVTHDRSLAAQLPRTVDLADINLAATVAVGDAR